MHRLPRQKPIPMIGSPVQKQIQRQPSVHSAARDRNSGASNLNWPNKPKRVYEVIPSLNGDSRKTSRQSSVNVQKENTKMSEPQSPLTPTRSIGKRKDNEFIFVFQFLEMFYYVQRLQSLVFNFVVNIIMHLKLKKSKLFLPMRKIAIINRPLMNFVKQVFMNH